METKSSVAIFAIFILCGLGLLCWGFGKLNIPILENISEQTAIETIKTEFPDLADYPSDQLPPRSIKTEKSSNGWYVAFIQEGSGVPIISARCFFVDDNKDILNDKEYTPKIDEDLAGDFSIKTCSPSKSTNQKCQLETCHGLDVVCGANPPDACTAMYALGDKCLQYVKCGNQNGQCQPTENENFNQCKSCVQNCLNIHENDNVALFTCESGCK